MLTPYHAKYFAHDLTRQAPPGASDQLSMSLFDASVDLNPHQIEAAMFALQSPLSEGVILADEVGLGKTIEAGIVLCQRWAEKRRRLLVLCPASIRKQWAMELEEKFNLPVTVLDARAYREARREGEPRPFERHGVVIASYHYAARMQDDIRMVPWDLVVIDEAHKLRNAYRPANKLGRALRWATEGRRKLLLTATPLQNSLMELYGLSTLIDDHIFGDANAFRARYANAGGDLPGLRQRLATFCKRTLRKQVLEYVNYTERHALTRPFRPTDDEQTLYDAVSAYLQRDDTYAIPYRQRHLTTLVLRKLLASSSHAIAGTLEKLRKRLEKLRDGQLAEDEPAFADELIEGEEIEEELLDEWLDDDEAEDDASAEPKIEPAKLRREIEELARLVERAEAIGTDTKSTALLKALEIGFEQMATKGAAEKALIFTESRRTQDYLKSFLERHGYGERIVLFNGTNSGPETRAIYDAWVAANSGGRATGSRAVDSRLALVEHFRDQATIMIATEAAAEGINLQFCSLVVNYDLPWNPQRIEQRIGRCHRYGQRHDVTVINFLNERNEADQRVYELLNEKFHLFSGLFGASDDVLGVLESGVDFEKRILAIYQQCRTPKAIEAAFRRLREELDDQIRSRIEETQRNLLEHFDEDVHARLRVRLEDARVQLDQFGRRFWEVTRHILDSRARFQDRDHSFDLLDPPTDTIRRGRYHLISKTRSAPEDEASTEFGYFLYRLSHPLGEHVIDAAKAAVTLPAALRFDITAHQGRIAAVEDLKGRSGYLTLNRLVVESFETEEYLLFSGFDDDGRSIDHESSVKLFNVAAVNAVPTLISSDVEQRLSDEVAQHVRATISRSLEANNRHFAVARERLEQWAEDMVLAAEKALKDTKEQIKAVRRQARQAETLQEQKQLQEKLQELERRQRKQRQQIFSVEDEIAERRDRLIAGLEKRLSRSQHAERLFTIRWSVT